MTDQSKDCAQNTTGLRDGELLLSAPGLVMLVAHTAFLEEQPKPRQRGMRWMNYALALAKQRGYRGGEAFRTHFSTLGDKDPEVSDRLVAEFLAYVPAEEFVGLSGARIVWMKQ